MPICLFCLYFLNLVSWIDYFNLLCFVGPESVLYHDVCLSCHLETDRVDVFGVFAVSLPIVLVLSLRTVAF